MTERVNPWLHLNQEDLEDIEDHDLAEALLMMQAESERYREATTRIERELRKRLDAIRATAMNVTGGQFVIPSSRVYNWDAGKLEQRLFPLLNEEQKDKAITWEEVPATRVPKVNTRYVVGLKDKLGRKVAEVIDACVTVDDVPGRMRFEEAKKK